MLIIPVLIYFNDKGNLENEQSFCPFKMVTGFPCPGCGITKSMVFFYDGNIYKMLHIKLLNFIDKFNSGSVDAGRIITFVIRFNICSKMIQL